MADGPDVPGGCLPCVLWWVGACGDTACAWPYSPLCCALQVELALEGADIWDDLRAVYNRFAISMVLSLGFHPVRGTPCPITW